MTMIRPIALRKALLHTLLSISIPLAGFVAQSSAMADSPSMRVRPSTSLFCIEVDNAGPSIDIPNIIDTLFGCYELRLNGESISLQGRSLKEAIAGLEHHKSTRPSVQVDGYFNGVKIGYELYWDGVRVGYEPGWTLQQAIENLEQNKAAYPDTQVEGRFYGYKVGYELYWDGVRVGYEPGWTHEQALENLQWNQQAYPNTVVQASYNGFPLR
ncbi:hypothetical protein IQ268_06110 [Oculatella sp. LEGE 06141]|uniref:hypothetical protein n=1 Tax=Oculatella sp. LEGE 06141 TaxID=1828648 RepID=UPI0018817073|nr:hypothetical protein [Oculatella sp. LEGE 06141]MBE9178157.1 hypothetical protein [Oculatella sp. LEGE 06141]